MHYTKSEIENENNTIEKAKQNRKYFESIYNKYFSCIFGFIYKRTGNKELSSDLTQQVFLKAMININQYQYKGLPFSAWLYRIALNEIHQYYRKTNKTQTILIDNIVINSIFEEITEDIKEDRLILLNALSKLSAKNMRLIELRFFDSKSFREIGEILGITENNAKTKLYRALDKLKKLMLKG